jgi:hypothetical protein
VSDRNSFHMFLPCWQALKPRMYASTTFDRSCPSAFLTAYARKQDIEILFAARDLVTLSSRMPKRVVEMNKYPIPGRLSTFDTSRRCCGLLALPKRPANTLGKHTRPAALATFTNSSYTDRVRPSPIVTFPPIREHIYCIVVGI